MKLVVGEINMNNFDINDFINDLHKKHFLKNLLLFLAGFIRDIA